MRDLSSSADHKLWCVYHHHGYGASFYLLWSDHTPTEEEVVSACHIDFEPEKEEYLEVDVVQAREIPILTASQRGDKS